MENTYDNEAIVSAIFDILKDARAGKDSYLTCDEYGEFMHMSAQDEDGEPMNMVSGPCEWVSFFEADVWAFHYEGIETATDQELLKYAEDNYGKGTEFEENLIHMVESHFSNNESRHRGFRWQ